MLSLLAENLEDVQDYGECWMEVFMVSLAGEMRLDFAVPLIVAKLRQAEKETHILFEEGERALVHVTRKTIETRVVG